MKAHARKSELVPLIKAGAPYRTSEGGLGASLQRWLFGKAVRSMAGYFRERKVSRAKRDKSAPFANVNTPHA